MYKRIVKKKIIFFSGNRSEYSLLLPIIKEIENFRNLKYWMVLSGSHVDKKYGGTIKEAIHDKIQNIIKMDISNNYREPAKIAISVSKVISKLTIIIQKIKPDILVVYGDRFETLGAVIAGHENNIVIGHVEGGDITQGGTHDDNNRHAITKLAHFHYTTNSLSYKRVLSLGEEKSRVKLAGFTAIDLIKKKNFSNRKEIIKKYGFKPNKPIFLLTMHPLSFSFEGTKIEIDVTLKSLAKAIKNLNADCMITYPNNDFGSDYILASIKKFYKNNNNVQLYKSLGRKDYWGIMNLIKFNFKVVCIGNSSSGIKESTAFNCPTVNIGKRQKGRLSGKNILHCEAKEENIHIAISKCIENKSFLVNCKKLKNPYGQGNAGKKIASHINSIILGEKTLIKKITI